MQSNFSSQLPGIEAIEHIRDSYHMAWFHFIFDKEETGFDVFFRSVDFSKLTDVKKKKLLTALENSAVQHTLIDYFTAAAVEFIFENYQFLQLNEQDEEALKKIYADLLNRIKILLAENQSIQMIENFLKAVLKGHFNELGDRIQQSFARNHADDATEKVKVPGTICHEYSPELQLKILNIDIAELTDPILDIGCGKSGKLVKYLKEKGFTVIGIDRLVEDSELLVKSEWLKYPMQQDFWGTIISHMSFSNHFIFHHLYKYGAPEMYAKKYMEILGSLKTGGSFYYSPGLPFIETFLPDSKFELKRTKVETPDANAERMHQLIDEDVFYSSRVRKIGL